MAEQILILDFGSQYTQLIARRVRELNVYCEIHPFSKIPELTDSIKGVILSGSPCSVREEDSPRIDLEALRGKVPVLGVCYGAQLLAHTGGGEVKPSAIREYGRAILTSVEQSNPLLAGISTDSQVWKSHGDTNFSLPDSYSIVSSTDAAAVFSILRSKSLALKSRAFYFIKIIFNI